MSTSLIPTVLDALVAAFDTALTIDVVDGPPTIDIPLTGLYVGATDADNLIEFTQDWAGLGHAARDESFEIPNLLWLRTGDNNLSTQRASVFTNLALIENTLRAAPALGISTNAVRAAFGTSGDFAQLQSPDGVVCRIRFTVTVQTRI